MTGRRTVDCARCGQRRPNAANGMCASCYQGELYRSRTPQLCGRCGRERLPFCRGLCKSCYQIIRRNPDAALTGSTEHREKKRLEGLANARRREDSPRWNGGRFIDDGGYVRIIKPDDYDGPCIHGGRYVHEHRYVAEKFVLHRALEAGEVVHHINHDRADNRPENLEVLPSVSAHRLLHVAEAMR